MLSVKGEKPVKRCRQEAVVVERVRIIQTAEREGVSAAAREHQCSRTTVYALCRRYEAAGLAGLCNRPRGPREPVVEELAELIVAVKLEGLHRSTAKVQQLVEERYGWRVSRQTVWRVLSTRGLARVIDREPLQRFERPHPNELWQLDLKEDVRTGAGTAHLLAVVDDATRFCLGGEWIRRKTEPAVLGALARVLRQCGVPEAILTDRGTVFFGPATRQAGLTTYQLALDALGVRACFAKPYKPRTKGKVEKFIQFVQRDFIREKADTVRDLAELNARWAGWVRWYNEQRPHASVGDLPPARHYQASRRAAPAELETLLRVHVPRKVARDGTISLRGQRYALPADLIGRHVWVGLLGDEIIVEHGGRTIATFGG